MVEVVDVEVVVAGMVVVDVVDVVEVVEVVEVVDVPSWPPEAWARASGANELATVIAATSQIVLRIFMHSLSAHVEPELSPEFLGGLQGIR